MEEILMVVGGALLALLELVSRPSDPASALFYDALSCLGRTKRDDEAGKA